MPRYVLEILFVIATAGCTVRQSGKVFPPDIPQPGREKIVGITTRNRDVFTFDSAGGNIAGRVLKGTVHKAPFEIAIDQIEHYWVERREFSKGRTVALVASVAAVGLIAWAVAANAGEESKPANSSCPFIYSWDGSSYVLDGEPYGGAITKGLERDDYIELAHLRADGGSYRLLVTNESDETQYSNLMALHVVDHPPKSQVVADANGTYHVISAPQPLVAARDQAGRDLLPWLNSNDRLIWEPAPVVDANGSIRNRIDLTFAKPGGARSVRLIANAATGTWGAFMMRESLAVHGRDLDAWYRTIDYNPEDRANLFAWTLREELYELKVYVKEPTGWEPRGILPGGGPVVAQNRVVTLDVSRVQGNQLQIQIRPPSG